MSTPPHPLFGGPNPWQSADWTSQDDRVRGGSSISYLIPSPDGTSAILNGTLDTKTLGGAGFASQRTTAERVWDLREWDGIEIVLRRGGGETNKKITFVLKDAVPSTYAEETTGRLREQSTISYEATFQPSGEGEGEECVFLPWVAFKATYRGREKEDADKVNLAGVRRFSLMARSFFDSQSGPFQVTLCSIAAVKAPRRRGLMGGREMYDEMEEMDSDNDEHDMTADVERQKRGGWGCRVV